MFFKIYQYRTNIRKYQKAKQEDCKYFQALLYEFKGFQGLEFSFSNSMTLKDFQALHELCTINTSSDCFRLLPSVKGTTLESESAETSISGKLSTGGNGT